MTVPVDCRAAGIERGLIVRALSELRHGRVRLALAENELAWAQAALASGHITISAALDILDITFENLSGDAR
jgi:hypothetical protein